jgi:ribosome recycling factor
MRGLFFLIIIALAGAVWYQNIELKKHRIKTDPSETLLQMKHDFNRATKEISHDAQREFEAVREDLGDRFHKIEKETTVREDEQNDKRRRR